MQEQLGNDLKEFRLVSQGMQLPPLDVECNEDSFCFKAIQDFGIVPGTTIDVLFRVRGGMPATAPRIKMPVRFSRPSIKPRFCAIRSLFFGAITRMLFGIFFTNA